MPKKRQGLLAPDDQIELDRLKKLYGVEKIRRALGRGPGRPKKLKSSQSGLVLAIDEMIEAYIDRGLEEKEARRMAFAEAQEILATETSSGRPVPGNKRRIISEATVRRYYREGVQELREGEMSLAKKVDEAAAKIGLSVALSHDYGVGGITRIRYDRGKRALRLAKAENN
jgi:hypothetical protein